MLNSRYNQVKRAIAGIVRSDGLRAKAMRGSAWLGGGSVAEQGFRFARNILLTRLLAPGAFGQMAIVMSAASVVETLTDVGGKTAVIQNPRGGEDTYVNASWWMMMVRSLCTYTIMFALAPWIARFYGSADLTGLIRVALLGTLFNGAISPRSVIPQKEMNFARWAAITNGGGVSGVITTVILSLFMRDVWALAIGYSSENAFRCILSYIVCPGLPSLKCDRAALRDLLTFSKGIFGLSFLTLIFMRADVFVLGRLYSSVTLGLYSMGVALVLTPSTFLTGVLGQTLIPAFSRVQDDLERFNRVLIEVTSWLALSGMPATMAVALCSPSVLRFAYGGRYAAAAGPLSVASAVVLLTALNAVITCALLAKGRPELHRYQGALTAAVMVLTIYPACRFLGPVGGQVAAIASLAAGYLVQVISMRRLTRLSLFQYGKIFVRPALASAGIFVIVLFGRRLGLATRPGADIAICAGTCLLAYIFSAPVLFRTLRRAGSPYGTQTPESIVAV